MSRLVDIEPLEKYLTRLINLAKRDEVGIRFPSADAWKSELEHLKELPTVNLSQRWISVKDSQPQKDGIYFAVYKFWRWNDCVSTRSLRMESGQKKITVERLGSGCRFQKLRTMMRSKE